LDTFQDNLKDLENAEVDDSAPPRLRQIILNNRDSLLKRMSGLSTSLRTPQSPDYGEIERYYDSSKAALEHSSKKAEKHYRHIKAMFKQQAYATLKDIKTFSQLLNSLKDTLEDYENVFRQVHETNSSIARLKEKLLSLKESEREAKRLKIELERSNEDLQRISKDLRLLTEDREWLHLKDLTNAKEKTETEMAKIKAEIIRTISPLEKSFKKLVKLIDIGVETFENRKTLELYINSPIDAIEHDRNLEALTSILRNIEKCILTDKLTLKDERREKTLAQIDSMQDKTRLQNLVQQYEALKKNRENIGEDLQKTDIQKEKDTLSGRSERIKVDIKNLEAKIQEMESRRKACLNEIEGLRKSLEKKLQEINGTRVSLTRLAS